MSREDGGNAFPIAEYDHMAMQPATVDEHRRQLMGMSMRDYFAAHAPDAPDDFGWNNGEATQCERLARWSYHYADAMLAARNA